MIRANSTWQLAARTLRRHPARTLLMGLGLVIGAASITLTVATGEGARRAVAARLQNQIGALDVLLIVQGGPVERGTSHLESAVTTLTLADVEAIARLVPNVSAVGADQIDLGAPIEANGRNGTTGLIGTTANWAAIRGDSVAAGALYTDADGAALARVAVIGADVAREHFPEGNAVGQHLRVRDVDLEVVGVLAPNGAEDRGNTGHLLNIDNVVYMPLATTQRRMLNRDHLNMIRVKLERNKRWQETEAAVTTLLREQHGISGAGLDDFRVISPEAMIARAANIDTTLRSALLWVGALSLLIGGVVIANLMFAATAARSREIGTRRAVGAARADVLKQFWTEAALVALGAALAGTLLAAALIQLGARLMQMDLAISWPVTLVTLGATTLIGALAGYFPARRAATLPPGVALRDAG
jgi:putative ABC transport system permease protein